MGMRSKRISQISRFLCSCPHIWQTWHWVPKRVAIVRGKMTIYLARPAQVSFSPAVRPIYVCLHIPITHSCSSVWLERSADNGEVPGSSPGWSSYFFLSLYCVGCVMNICHRPHQRTTQLLPSLAGFAGFLKLTCEALELPGGTWVTCRANVAHPPPASHLSKETLAWRTRDRNPVQPTL